NLLHCSTPDLKTQAITALKKYIHYTNEKVELIPLDTLYGLRVAQGLLLDSLDPEIIQLPLEIEKLMKKAIPIQKKLHTKYYKTFKKLIQSPVIPLKPPKKSLPPPDEKKPLKTKFSEKVSDVCLNQALRCKPSWKCLKL